MNFTNAAAWNKIFKRSYIEQLKLDFQPVRNGNDVYFTVNAIGLADRITVLNEKLVNYRVNQSSGLVCSISKSPLSPIQAWMDIAENLEKHDGFGERSFANKAMGSMIYMLQNFQKWDAFRQAVEALKEYGLEKCIFRYRKTDTIIVPGMANVSDICIRIHRKNLPFFCIFRICSKIGSVC